MIDPYLTPVGPQPVAPEVHYTLWPESKFWEVPLLPETDGSFHVAPTGAARVVVLVGPGGKEALRDTGFRVVSLVFIVKGKAVGRSPLCSDVVWSYLFPDVIHPMRAGYEFAGYESRARARGSLDPGDPRLISTGYERIEMDWLPNSGLLRFWCGDGKKVMTSGPIMSMADLRFTDPDLETSSPHLDDLRTVRRRMTEWVKAYGAAELRVALDEALEAS